MKHVFKFLFLASSFTLLINCAKTGRPEGGPKDEIAPLFVKATPPYESVKFDKKEIKINFNEYITLKDLNKQLVISPPMKNAPIISPQGTPSEFIKIKIIDTLKTNTTYILNFGNAVQDNNEGNKLENFKYVFSTGTYIDSLTTKGNTKDAYLNETQKNINVLLYKMDSTFTDSIIYKEKPNYITNTLDSTLFNFTNIKEGKYFLVALKEPINDYQFNPRTDKIGFLLDTITLPRDSIITTDISIFSENLPYTFKRGAEVSKGKIQFGFSGKTKKINVEIQSETPDNFKSISKFEVGKDTLNYWFTPFEADSLNFIVSSQEIKDTLTVFLRKKQIDSLILKSIISQTLHFRDTFFLESNNPIVQLDTSKISLKKQDSISINFKSFLSSKDNKIGFLFEKTPKQNYKLNILPEAFSDIFSHKNDSLSYDFKTIEIEDYSKITLNVINSKSENLIIELIDDKQNVVASEVTNTSGDVVFELLEPKTYFIRAIVDTNKNNKWDTGNYLKKQLPEKIIYFEKELALTANHYLIETFLID